jgi:hypothetical protein
MSAPVQPRSASGTDWVRIVRKISEREFERAVVNRYAARASEPR